MAEFDDQNDEFVVLNLANQAVVADPIAPVGGQFALQGFAGHTGIVLVDQLIEKCLDSVADRFFQLVDGFGGAGLQPNAPRHRVVAPSPPS